MARIAAAVTAALLLLPACGGDAADVAAETADNLASLRSGLIELRVEVASAPDEEGEAAEAGFELIGSFQLPEEGRLPVADVEFTDIGLAEPATRGFISTDERAFIEVEGQAYELPPEQTQELVGGSGGAEDLFADAAVDEWLVEPRLRSGESLEGAKVDRVTGELDVVTALNDLFSLAERFGSTTDYGRIEGEEAERLRSAVESSHIEIVSGAEDRLLRRLLIEVELALDEQLGLADLLGPLAGTTFTLDLSISQPNEPIEVEEPTDALPLEELMAPS